MTEVGPLGLVVEVEVVCCVYELELVSLILRRDVSKTETLRAPTGEQFKR